MLTTQNLLCRFTEMILEKETEKKRRKQVWYSIATQKVQVEVGLRLIQILLKRKKSQKKATLRNNRNS